MFRQPWFQLHWLLGISAGLVIALMGVTGAMLSFETDLLRLINPGVMTVEAGTAAPLSPGELVARVRAARPDTPVASLTLAAEPTDAARVSFAPPPGQRRGERRYLDPYSGELLGEPRGEAFFRTTMQLHRWLVAGDTGKAVTGASTVALIVLCLSGLYLRWPRKPLNWRSWLRIDFQHKGRSFLWSLHAVAGTWVLLLYLLAGFTALYWSYDWYRAGLYSLTGATPPQRARPAAKDPDQAPAEAADGIPAADIDAAWQTFLAEAGGFSTVTLRLPERAGRAVELRYLAADPAHERAFDSFSVDPAGREVIKQARYADKTVGEKIMSSMLPLHSGSFFGLPGLLAMMIASAVMPLFFITGWMLYLGRRTKKKALRAARDAVALPSRPAADDDTLLIGYASQTGFAAQLAWQTAGLLQAAGLPVTVRPLAELSGGGLREYTRALFVVSTFGEGEPPDSARGFARKVMSEAAALGGLRFGLLSVGNRRYSTFCGFGRALDAWLRRHGAEPLFPALELDSDAPGAGLRDWQRRLVELDGASGAAAPGWKAPSYGRWRLAERRRLNPGSLGGPTFHVELAPIEPAEADWQPGDLVEIRLPTTETGEPAQTRQYSIASLPGDGRVHLLIRQVRQAQGLGLGSGWLTESASPGSEIALRVQSNPAFQPPPVTTPMILIGNGTGLAGLRAHLKARAQQGRGRNWLIFGERTAEQDFYYRDEVEAWQRQGVLDRLDLAFSREGGGYVQDRLRQAGPIVRAWLDEGAAIYVCGSLDGMAPGVEAALLELIGAEGLARLSAENRYRRDVY